MVAFIEDPITEEELCSKPSQKLLIVDRWPFGILLNLEIPFDFVKPGFVCHFFGIDLTVVCWFILPLNGNLGSFIVPPNLEHRSHGS